MLGLAWLPIFSRSRKPLVVSSAHLSPRRSSKALVATVVPILIAAILLVSRGRSRG